MTMNLIVPLLAGGAAAAGAYALPAALASAGPRPRRGRSGRPGRGPRRARRGRAVVLLPTSGAVAAWWRVFAGDGASPMDRALRAKHPEFKGATALKWRALYAGYGGRTLLWLRVRQAKNAAAIVLTALGLCVVGAVPVAALAPVAVVAVALSFPIMRAELNARVPARQRLIRLELVQFLNNLANAVRNGSSLKEALRDAADDRRGGELARELDVVADLIAIRVPLADALDIFACRCNTPEAETAVQRMQAALKTASDQRAMADELTRLARETLHRALTDVRAHSKENAIRTTAVIVLTVMPVYMIDILAPPGAQFLRAMTGLF
jgi:hypothetical protein